MNTAFVFDFDGTITKQELLPLIGKSLGLLEEIKILTDLTIKGLISFESSMRLRFAILKSASISQVHDAIAQVELDKNITEFINSNSDHCYVVTGNILPWIEPLAQKLKCMFISSHAVVEDNKVTELKEIMDKSKPLLALKKQYRRIVTIGEGANDLPMFEMSDIAIAYGGVHKPAPILLNNSDYYVLKSESLCRLLNTLS